LKDKQEVVEQNYFYNLNYVYQYIAYGGVIMKFWTIQSQEVLEIIKKEDVYHPKFAMSQYYKQYYELYNFMLKSLNNINNLNCDGLIFSFCISNQEVIYPKANIEGFRYIINKNKEKIT
jgi:hypothetical protein